MKSRLKVKRRTCIRGHIRFLCLTPEETEYMLRGLMTKNILFLCPRGEKFCLPLIEDFKSRYSDIETEFILSPDIASVEHLFFEQTIHLIIFDFSLEGAVDFFREFKADEMFCHVPVLPILKEHSLSLIKQCADAGFLTYVEEPHLAELFSPTVHGLLKRNFFEADLLSKVSELQEQAINDFILLDLVKAYIPQTIWKRAKVFAHEQKIAIPEEELDLTIVFADIKGFTTMTEHMAPRDVIASLNSVFEAVTRIVYEKGGDIDKFIGDAFFAVFSDPKDAVEAMVLVQQEISGLNRKRLEQGESEIYFRIGIHTGPVIRGNVGGNQRYDNTLIGNTVNTASRIEHIAPAGGIMVSQAVVTKAGLKIPAEKSQKVKLRGKDQEETVYCLNDGVNDLSCHLDAAPGKQKVTEF